MKASLLASWNAWTDHLEGHVSWMYLDTHDPPLVTIGRGNLIDPVTTAVALAFVHVDNTPATMKEIRAEWNTVKGLTRLAKVGAYSFKAYCALRLPNEAIDELCLKRLTANEDIVKQQFPGGTPSRLTLNAVSCRWHGPGVRMAFVRLIRASRPSWTLTIGRGRQGSLSCMGVHKNETSKPRAVSCSRYQETPNYAPKTR